VRGSRVGRAHKHRVRAFRRSENNPLIFLDLAVEEGEKEEDGKGEEEDKAAAPPSPPPQPSQLLPLGRLAIELWCDLVPRAGELVRRVVSGDVAPRTGDLRRFGAPAEGPTPAAVIALSRHRRRGGGAGGGGGRGTGGPASAAASSSAAAATGMKPIPEHGEEEEGDEEEEDDEEGGDHHHHDSAAAAAAATAAIPDEPSEEDDEQEGPLGRIHYPEPLPLPEDDDLLVGGLVVPASQEPLPPPLPPHAAAAEAAELSASASGWPCSHPPPAATTAHDNNDNESDSSSSLGITSSGGSEDEGGDAREARRRLARRLRRAFDRDVQQRARVEAVVRESLLEAEKEKKQEEAKQKAKQQEEAAGAAAPPSATITATAQAATPVPSYARSHVDFAEPKGWVRFMPLANERHPQAAAPPPRKAQRAALRWYRQCEGMRSFAGLASGEGSCPLLLHSRPFLLSVAARELEALAAYYTACGPHAVAAAAAAAGSRLSTQPDPPFPGLPSLCVLTGPCHELDDGRVIVGQALAGYGSIREASQCLRERVPSGETGSELSSPGKAGMAGGRCTAMRPYRRVVLSTTGQLSPLPVVLGKALEHLPVSPAQATSLTGLGKWCLAASEAVAAGEGGGWWGAVAGGGALAPPAAAADGDNADPDAESLASVTPVRDPDGFWPLWPEDQPLLPAGRDPSEEVQFRLEVAAALRARGNELLQRWQEEQEQKKNNNNIDYDLALQAADRYDQARRYLGWTTMRSTADLTHGQQLGLWQEETSLSLNRAAALSCAQRWSEAASEAASCARRAPRDPRVHYRLGRARLELGELAEAMEALSEAAKLAPADARVRAELVRCRAALAEREKALGKALRGALARGVLLSKEGGEEEEEEEGKSAATTAPPDAARLAAARLAAKHPSAGPRPPGVAAAASGAAGLPGSGPANYTWGFYDEERRAQEEAEAVRLQAEGAEEEDEQGEGDDVGAADQDAGLGAAATAAVGKQAPERYSPEELLVAAVLAAATVPAVAEDEEAKAATSAPAAVPPPPPPPPRLSSRDAARVRQMLEPWLEFA
jgi:hypothetical protein